MRFFGYYALHSFINQLRKLFKTWVLVFILVCGLMGGLIGFGAAMLDETIEENREPEIVTEVPEEEEKPGFQLDISSTALVELVAGGALLALFAFEALSADKNGSKIFLPADVNLLFPSPMKPQSVLMFRLATQLGTALVATIYLLFQLPNLILNLGMSGWTAAAVMATWFSGILIGKLLQVLLYTICSTHPEFKKYLSRGVYALCLVLVGGFLACYKTGTDSILVAADRFFNAPVTRWVPFWGWLKGMAAAVSEQNWAMAALFLGLTVVGCAGMVYGIWNINADFYEDAMAKSEETAAIMEKARSEKTSGVAVTRQRKKDRSDSLLRDGFHRGWGANVFFTKSMYNRFRFAHLHFFTKTMETYLVAAVGGAAALRFYFGMNEIWPIAMLLGALVFFRAMGNPLTEDTSMDFFRLIPESTWQKLFFSLFAGTVNCLLDLLLPMLLSCAVMMVNPLKLLVWLPLIVSVDFYATSTVTFIDLSVPASIGKTIKQLITILFIYFGLVPDIAILAFGIALGHTVPAAVGSAVLNALLGIASLSLASVFLQPKGKDYLQTVADQDLKLAKNRFSRVGFAVFAILAVVTVLQLAASAVVYSLFPEVLESAWGIWLMTFAPQYLIGMPVGVWILTRAPGEAPKQNPMGLARTVKFVFICIFAMYGGNLVGNLVTAAIGMFRSSEVVNPLMAYVTDSNLFAQILVIVILAPCFEEFVFRKLLIDRMAPYGGKTAVLMSGLLFGLFHGNFSQFFYAFALGMVFGYIYLNTGKLRNTIIAHMIVNFMGSIFAPELLRRMPDDLALAESNPYVMLFGGYTILLIAGAVVGLVLLVMNARNLTWPTGRLELPKGKRFQVACLNPGMIVAVLTCVGMMIYSVLA